MTKKQDVMYNFLDWPARKSAKLIVIGIANTMDLPERLMPRVSSRLGLTRIAFAPYNRTQLEIIINSRLESIIHLFAENTIELCARKVSSISGDVRRALHICRRAINIAENRYNKQLKEQGSDQKLLIKQKQDIIKPLVTLSDIETANKDLFSTTYVLIIKNSSLYEKLLYKSCFKLMSRYGIYKLDFYDVCHQIINLARLRGITPLPTLNELDLMCRRMQNVRIIDLIFNKIKDIIKLYMSTTRYI